MVRVWRNECLRVFHDRLINEDDKELVRAQSHADAPARGSRVGGRRAWRGGAGQQTRVLPCSEETLKTEGGGEEGGEQRLAAGREWAP